MILGGSEAPKKTTEMGRIPGKVVHDTRQSCTDLLGKLKNKYYKYFNPQPPTLVGGLLYF